MPSNFTSNSTDLDDIFVLRSETVLGNYPYALSGKLWSWGYNNYGVLGHGDAILVHRSSPTQIGSLLTWNNIAYSGGGYHESIHATKTDGTLWAWGEGAGGRLGLNHTQSMSSPTQVGNLTDWVKVAQGEFGAASIKTNGTLWTWGNSVLSPILRLLSSPVQVGTSTDWNKLAIGRYSLLLTKTDNSMWSAGSNTKGVLGYPNITSASSPIQIGTLKDWSAISCGASFCLAVKTTGTLWAWGSGSRGELGLSTTNSYGSPVQVGSLTDWKLVICGRYNAAAIKIDGTLWTWGENMYGVLGIGINDWPRSSPTQIGSLTDWKLIHCSAYHSLAIKTDGSLWAWGLNSNGTGQEAGMLGDNTRINRSSPIQIGTATNWLQVATRRYNSFGITV